MNRLSHQSRTLLAAITIGLGFAVLGMGCTQQGNDNAGSGSSMAGAATSGRAGSDHRLGTGNSQADTNGDMAAGAGNSNRPVSDTWITTKVKTALATTQGVDSSNVHVETNNGVVTLTGQVDSQKMLDAAIAKIKTVEGVRGVDASRLKIGGGTGQ